MSSTSEVEAATLLMFSAPFDEGVIGAIKLLPCREKKIAEKPDRLCQRNAFSHRRFNPLTPRSLPRHLPLWMITCRQLIDLIDDYLAGELDEDEREEFELHLDLCLSCQAYLDSYRRTVALVRRFAHL